MDGVTLFGSSTLVISGNAFSGTIEDDLLDVTGPGNSLSGTGNTNDAVIVDRLCEADGAGAFVGTVEVNGTLLQDNVPPCN